MVGLVAGRIALDQPHQPVVLVVVRDVVPASALWLPVAGETLTLPQGEIHCVAALKPVIEVVDPAVAIDFEDTGLVVIVGKERLDPACRIDPKASVLLGFGHTGNDAVGFQ